MYSEVPLDLPLKDERSSWLYVELKLVPWIPEVTPYPFNSLSGVARIRCGKVEIAVWRLSYVST